jgi:hypothetical protein
MTRRLTTVWAGLVVATVVAVVLGESLKDHSTSEALGTTLVLLVAVVKLRFVGMELMGLRRAPRPLVVGFHAWCAGMLVLLTAVYLLAR